MTQARIAPCTVHGLDLSYFTGKLEAYLRAKGILYRLQPMTARDFERLAAHTAVRQMPKLHCADGRWLTDTTQIIATLEQECPTPAITPPCPRALAAFTDALASRRFVLGDRPSEADFGLFGPMFRHFFCDPTPARIMRDTAPLWHADWAGILFFF